MNRIDEIKQVLASFKEHGFVTHYANNCAEAVSVCLSLVKKSNSFAFGGSKTLGQLELAKALEDHGAIMCKRPSMDIPPDKRYEEMQKALLVDVFFSSSNAITRDGKLVNIDGSGNRVASQIYGPKKVVIVAGYNKITGTLEEAMYRVRNIATPPNVRRFDTKAPCDSLCFCPDCGTHGGRICCDVSVIEHVKLKNRIHLVLINEVLGF